MHGMPAVRELRLCCNCDLTMLGRCVWEERTCRRAGLSRWCKDLKRARKLWSLLQVYLFQVAFRT